MMKFKCEVHDILDTNANPQCSERREGIKPDVEGFEAKAPRAFFRDAGSVPQPDFIIPEVNPVRNSRRSLIGNSD